MPSFTESTIEEAAMTCKETLKVFFVVRSRHRMESDDICPFPNFGKRPLGSET
jgi:hypothetical protein